MNLLLVVENGRARRWMTKLARRLITLGADVRVETVAAAVAADRGVELLLDLEHLLRRRLRDCGADRIETSAIAPVADAGFAPDLVIDLTATPSPRAGIPVLAVAYDGVHGEDGAIAALTAGATPVAEVVDLAEGRVLERGLASLEAAAGLGGGIDAVSSRIITLIEARLAARIAGRERADPPTIEPAPRGARRPLALRVGTSVAGSVARAIYRLCCHAPHWRTGWRLHDGPGIGETGDFSGPRFNVLPDPGHRFYADPFPAARDGRAWVFVEDLDHRHGKGIVSAIPFDDEGPSGPAIPVLEEPWHLSYPFMIEHGGELWMIPESSNARDVAIYRCARFPDRWERAATLLDDVSLSDATVLEDGGRWWMFGTVYDGEGGWSDVLAIYSAPSLFGPWTALEANPVLIDRTNARPAGHFFRHDGRLFRPVQDCSGGYGSALAIAEITRLDDGGYDQIVRHRLAPGRHWPGRRLHTLNRLGRLEVIDGSVVRPKSTFLAGLVEASTVPSEGSR